jgi:hypothetical protein
MCVGSNLGGTVYFQNMLIAVGMPTVNSIGLYCRDHF